MSEFGPDVIINNAAYIHPTALIYGKARLEQGVSLWPYTVIRAESSEVVVGEYTNIQDFVMIHVGSGTPSIIGAHCSITHHCTIHGCTIGDNCLIGINTTIMDGCVIGDNCIVAGHSFLKEGTVIPDNSIVMGTPGQVVRTQNNYARCRMNAFLYYRNALAYGRGEHREWASDDCLQQMQVEMEKLQEEQARIESRGGTLV
ncbi:MAG: gamma carbonic anhydrase family protein [Sneathiella sp.]|jgi:carbonic anhydrase/acetyltransferase-like protein (isoleucine patch superfamily)|uniref:gamma carbonic anhydrase family protein n=1 Tax=Sneathiella sp. TaxID=1964365 RepID=UPI000C5F16A1|nr:gamma carbonic anhydrase family protein [Sneathiella sp.]MAL77569.1 gamma carbonic anhydrase family protein [Sneathiella sp.]